MHAIGVPSLEQILGSVCAQSVEVTKAALTTSRHPSTLLQSIVEPTLTHPRGWEGGPGTPSLFPRLATRGMQTFVSAGQSGRLSRFQWSTNSARRNSVSMGYQSQNLEVSIRSR